MIKLGLVGCGSWGPRYCNPIEALDDVMLVGFSDSRVDRAEALSRTIPSSVVYQYPVDMFQSGDIDGVIIVTPTPSHHDLVMQALEARKHVLVEKPIAIDLHETFRMVKKAEAMGCNLMVGQIVRFIPTISRAREIIHSGGIGRVLHVSERRYGRFRTDAWPEWWKQMEAFLLLHLGSHSVDAILWILDRKPLWAFAQGLSRKVDNQYGAVDAFSLSVGLEGDVLVTIDHEAYGGRPDLAYELLVVGEEGIIRFDGFNRLLVNEKPNMIVEGDFFSNALQTEVAEFIASIREERLPSVSGFAVIPTVAVLDAGRKSIKTFKRETVEYHHIANECNSQGAFHT